MFDSGKTQYLPIAKQGNFNLDLLHSMADRFGFIVDVRGPWPLMIRGMHAAVYTTHRDALHFISVPMEVK